jgi:DNA-binding LacI/PurR family transcriptional regulator
MKRLAEGKRRATILDVARATGLAPSTISNALSNKSCVTEATRARVVSAAQQLGYRASLAAQSLRKKQTWSVGLLAGDIASSLFFPEILTRIESALWSSGYTLILSDTEFDPSKQTACIRSMLDRLVDGLILASQDLGEQDVAEIRRQGVPVACYNVDVPDVAADYVGVDNDFGCRLAMQHLTGLGHKRIGFIGGRRGSGSAAARLKAYLDEVRRQRLSASDTLVEQGNWNIESGHTMALQLLSLPKPPTAIVCANDSLALGALGALAQSGVKVPEDISVVGFDDIALAAHPLFGLTTVRYPKDEVAELTARLLTERIGKPERRPQKIVLRPTMVVRRTAGPPPRPGGRPRRARPAQWAS